MAASINRAGALSRVTVATLTAALVATGTSAVAADNPGASKTPADTFVAAEQAQLAQQDRIGARSTAKAAATAEYRWLRGLSGGNLYLYEPDGRGGYGPRHHIATGGETVSNAAQADNDGDGKAESVWLWFSDGTLDYATPTSAITVGGGWNIFNKVISPGNLGGAASADLIARDKAGDLWLYLGYANGKVAPRKKIGSGWNIYQHIAGVGDLTGDGKADIVTADKSGVLWIHPGSGDYNKPFKPRVKIGGGWNTFNYLAGVGDLDNDGKSDLIARDKAGALFRYSGTGTTAKPFKPMAKIGTSGWNTYRLMY
ncbi:FG-GAP repeat domain-containing protein [Streptomyces sp. NPDC058953]|uniref:FG-GAP repeat domain-containing protein n=1 Tax=unclassified Streptomyces TaxID=2593676 RepID=UPI0036C94F6E